ncbi:aldo/keto reductase [Aestuariimicrobium kwangyangense]|uniref:aldo/keto reductase n=1 Tax=Aestuariimicrobium kwangyangense TaxID=396389 RepID=UPI0003B759E4|nr:aldo/keto reductase [Aestuariimicrobium kwangyangense]
MEERHVGASGLKVSTVGLGTMTWGRDTSPEVGRHLLRGFVDAGGTLVDTAPAYGQGIAEKIIGKSIHTDLRRDDLVIATKAGFGLHDGRRVVDTSRRTMLTDLAASLRRLHTDHVDLWQVHAWGDAPLEETLEALDQAVSKGMARYVGVSNFVGWQTAQAATWQRAVPGRAALVSAQVEYSLLARRAEVEVVPAAQALGLGVLAWSAIGRGVLTGKYRTGVPRGSRGALDHFSWFVEPYLEPKPRAITDAVATAAQGLELSPAQVALLWTRDAPGVASALVGPRSVAHLDELMGVVGQRLPGEITAALDDISGGPNVARHLS